MVGTSLQWSYVYGGQKVPEWILNDPSTLKADREQCERDLQNRLEKQE